MKSIAPLFLLVAAIAIFMTADEKDSLPDFISEPRLVVRKSARALDLYDGKKLLKTYAVVLGAEPDGDKEVEGDGRTPIGEFYVFTKNVKSRFHLSLGVSYPSDEDAERGFASGIITSGERDEIVDAVNRGEMPPQKTKLGGEIYIHGGGRDGDWTQGCVALENDEMTELFAAVPLGTKITILP